MKKRKKILSIVSSVFGVAALCGLFSLSILSSDKKNIETSAVSEVIVDTKGVTNLSIPLYGNHVYVDIPNNIAEIEFNPTPFVINLSMYLDLYKCYFPEGIKYRIGVVFGATIYSYELSDIPRYVLRNFDTGVTEYSFSTGYFDLSTLDYTVQLRYSNMQASYPYSPVNASNYFALGFNIVDSNNLSSVYYSDNILCQFLGVTVSDNRPSSQDSLWVTFSTQWDLGNGNYLYCSPYNLFSSVFVISNSEYDSGYAVGYNSGYTQGFNTGNSMGYNVGYAAGYSQANSEFQQMLDNAYTNGYNDGYNDGSIEDGTAATIFSGILQVGLLPINMFLAMMNFNILGINVSSFVSALLTVCITIIVINAVIGNSGGGKE